VSSVQNTLNTVHRAVHGAACQQPKFQNHWNCSGASRLPWKNWRISSVPKNGSTLTTNARRWPLLRLQRVLSRSLKLPENWESVEQQPAATRGSAGLWIRLWSIGEPVKLGRRINGGNSVASVGKDGSGWRIRFIDQDGVRRTIRPGKMPKSDANDIGRHVDQIANAKAAGQPISRQTAVWLSEIGDTLHAKLHRAGLVSERGTANLEDFVRSHIERGQTADRKPAAESTKRKWKAAAQHLTAFFGNEPLRNITEQDAEKFRRWLEDQPVADHWLAENTIRSVMACTKTFLNAAVRRGLVDANPFAREVSGTQKNRARDYYVKPADLQRILDACPNEQWRLMVVLWRLAGLRKTEIYHLRWSGVLWDSGRILVQSPKTAHHEGRAERFVPIGDVLPWLRVAFEAAAEGSDRLITQYTATNSNLDKPFRKILQQAGLVPWPKLFQNMRASCETDWLDRGIAAHVVANWIGHSVHVQVKSYAQVDDHHFAKFNEQSPKNLAHNPAQQIAADRSNGPQDTSNTQQKR